MSESISTELSSYLDQDQLSVVSLALFALLALVLATDGFDLLIMGFTAPAIAKEFAMSRLDLGTFLTASHGAVALGGVAGGVIGDRFGRMSAIRGSVILFAAATLAATVARDFHGFVVLRIAASLGMGAATPNVAAYLLETVPKRWRGELSTFAYATMVLGSTLCGLAARELLSAHGWRVLFQIGGIAPLILWPLLWILPESPAFLLVRGASDGHIARALCRLTGRSHLPAIPSFTRPIANPANKGRRELFSNIYRRDTFSLWILAFAVMFTAVAITSMGTTLMTSAGAPLADAITGLLAFNVSGLVGAVAAGLLIGQFGSRTTLCGLLPISTIALLAFAYVLSNHTLLQQWLIPVMSACGFGLTSVYISIYPLAAQVYPIDIRSTGAGAALGIGRLGATLSAVATAALLVRSVPMVPLALAAMTAAGLAALITLRRHVAAIDSQRRRWR